MTSDGLNDLGRPRWPEMADWPMAIGRGPSISSPRPGLADFRARPPAPPKKLYLGGVAYTNFMKLGCMLQIKSRTSIHELKLLGADEEINWEWPSVIYYLMVTKGVTIIWQKLLRQQLYAAEEGSCGMYFNSFKITNVSNVVSHNAVEFWHFSSIPSWALAEAV